MTIIPSQSGTYLYLPDRVTDLLADSGQTGGLKISAMPSDAQACWPGKIADVL
jgi:hypothetical protein